VRFLLLIFKSNTHLKNIFLYNKMQRVLIVLSVISIVLSIVALVIANRKHHGHHHHHNNLSNVLVPLSATDTVVYADETAPVVKPKVPGWVFVNTLNTLTNVSNKINWYFYNAATALNNITLGAVASSKDLGYWAVIVPSVTGTAFPVLAIYTYPPTGVTTPWYTSKVTFDSTGSDLTKYAANSPVLIYTGTDNNTHFPAIPVSQRLKYTYNSAASDPTNTNPPDPSQQILLATLATYGGTTATGTYNFSARYLGLTSKAFNPTYLLMNS
jgi:hypothetical protein